MEQGAFMGVAVTDLDHDRVVTLQGKARLGLHRPMFCW
jgi:hypothetical protein